MKRLLLSIISVLIYLVTLSQDVPDIIAAEYFIDADPGVGNGTSINIGTSGSTVNFIASFSTNSLFTGFHNVFFRTKDATGKWGLSESRGFYISNATTDVTNIINAEYFIDSDPGVGNGNTLNVGTTGGTVNFIASIPTTALVPGFHNLFIRTKDASGNWGLFESRGFYISNATTDVTNIINAEYFIDSDPGVGNGNTLNVGTTGGIVNFIALIPTTALVPGFHNLFIRTKDASGNWGLFESRGFYISTIKTDVGNIVSGEYFFDADPGVGNATPFAFTTPDAITNQTFTFPVPNTLSSGTHFLFLRTKNTDGTWGLFEIGTFTSSGGGLPVTGLSLVAKKEGTTVKLDWFTLTEINSSHFEIERSLNGISFEKIGILQSVGNSNNRKDYGFVDIVPGKNLNYYKIKQVDRDGKFVNSEVRLVKFADDKQFKIYPVITTSQLHIDGITEPVKIKLFNGSGLLVKTTSLNNLSGALDISNLAAGMYWLLIERNGELLFTQKIIKP